MWESSLFLKIQEACKVTYRITIELNIYVLHVSSIVEKFVDCVV